MVCNVCCTLGHYCTEFLISPISQQISVCNQNDNVITVHFLQMCFFNLEPKKNPVSLQLSKIDWNPFRITLEKCVPSLGFFLLKILESDMKYILVNSNLFAVSIYLFSLKIFVQ